MKAFIVCKYTLLELFRSRILYNVFFLGILLVGLCLLASELTYGVPKRIAVDLGLGMSSLSSILIAIFLGGSLIAREVEERTVHMILARPISRESFVIGKSLGLLSILFINSLMLYSISLTVFFVLGGEFSHLLIWCFLFGFLEAAIMLLLVIFLSFYFGHVLNVILSLVIYFLGHSLDSTLQITFVKTRPLLSSFLDLASQIIPNFSKLNIKDFVLYKQSLTAAYLMNSLGYAMVFIVFLIFINCLVFRYKSLD